jgi:casein kinase II subunit beta
VPEPNIGSSFSWISWFCSIPEKEYFIQVPEAWIEDDFNIQGISLPDYEQALDVILGYDSAEDYDGSPETLYSIIHARYLCTKQGLEIMANRVMEEYYGVCPRWHCGNCAVAPCGVSDDVGVATVKLYCPRCNDIYDPPKASLLIQECNIDGAAFGTTFATFLFETYKSQLVPPLKISNDDTEHRVTRDYGVYTLKVYGFKVNSRSPFGPRTTWLRYKDTNES